MKRILVFSIILPLFLLSAEVETTELKTHTELSYIQTSGNTDTKSFGLDFSAEKSWKPHKVTLDVDAYYAENDGDVSKNVWKSEINYYYFFNDDLEFDYLLGYKKDRFSGFDYQMYTGPGLKYRALNLPKHTLFLSGNVLYSVDKIKEAGTDSYASWRAGLDYEYRIVENLKFKEEANIRSQFSDLKNYFVYSKSSIESKINDHFSLGVSYKIDYKNTPPEGKKKSDRTFMVSLVIDW
ncbi:DUF481 domain-containing protein [Nitrosophilus alvini]|uniref:DUF481 domain-containing protein n=1 Tax=Nitrosophilus alvini TaxID=2714855 RepID=UPI00190D263D|nr:DUF481 domain-containing protein [Nitrosophilus alvini]